MARYGSDEYKAEKDEAGKRIRKVSSVTISGVTFTKAENDTKLLIQIGKEKAEWDYYDWLAFDDEKYGLGPKKIEEVILDTMAGKEKP